LGGDKMINRNNIDEIFHLFYGLVMMIIGLVSIFTVILPNHNLGLGYHDYFIIFLLTIVLLGGLGCFSIGLVFVRDSIINLEQGSETKKKLNYELTIESI
jgi:hypothetical protein